MSSHRPYAHLSTSLLRARLHISDDVGEHASKDAALEVQHRLFEHLDIINKVNPFPAIAEDEIAPKTFYLSYLIDKTAC